MTFLKGLWSVIVGASIGFGIWVAFVAILALLVLFSMSVNAADVAVRPATIGEQDRSVLGNDTVYTPVFLGNDGVEISLDTLGQQIPQHTPTSIEVLNHVCTDYCRYEIDRRIVKELLRLEREVIILRKGLNAVEAINREPVP